MKADGTTRGRERIEREISRNYDPVAVERQTATLFYSAGDRRDELEDLRAPVVVLHGDKDIVVPVENGKETAAVIPDAELIIVPGLSHDVPLQLVQMFPDAITAAASRGAE